MAPLRQAPAPSLAQGQLEGKVLLPGLEREALEQAPEAEAQGQWALQPVLVEAVQAVRQAQKAPVQVLVVEAEGAEGAWSPGQVLPLALEQVEKVPGQIAAAGGPGLDLVPEQVLLVQAPADLQQALVEGLELDPQAGPLGQARAVVLPQ